MPGEDENKFGTVVRDAIGFGVFGTLAGVLLSLDQKVWGLWFSFVALASALHIPAHYMAKKRARRKALWWSLYGITIAGSAIWFGFWTFALARNSRESDRISVVALERYIELEKPRNLLRWNINDQTILSPIHVELLAQITNLKARSVTVRSYQFEGRMAHGWRVLPTIDIDAGSVMWLTSSNFDRSQVVLRKHYGSNILPFALRNKTIAPGDTVTAFAFLEVPKGRFGGEIRLRLRDATEKEFVEPVGLALSPTLNTAISVGGVSLTRETEDISKLPLRRYSEGWKR